MRAFWKITRYARAAKFWLLVLLALGAYFGITEARAQSCPPLLSGIPGHSPTRTAEMALQECNSFPAIIAGAGVPSFHERFGNRTCTLNEVIKTVTVRYRSIGIWSDCSTNYSGPTAAEREGSGWGWEEYCPEGETWNAATQQCDVTPDCDVNDPPLTGGMIQGSSSDPNSCAITTCNGGCEYLSHSNPTMQFWVIDEIAYCSVAGWTPTGNNCTAGPNDGAELPPDDDGDGTSNPNDEAPNNPGDNGDESGEDDSDDECGGEGQPACDSSGGGNENTSGGGGNCGSPPHSSGDAILAQIAYQTWATRCAVEGNANEGGGVIPGTGEGECAAGDANCNGVADVMEAGVSEGESETPEVGTVGADAWDGVDMGGWLGGATCPGLPTEIDPRMSEQACNQGAMLRDFMLLLATVFAAAIIGRSAAGA